MTPSFDFWKSGNQPTQYHFVLGGKHGSILHYLWQKPSHINLLEVFNDHANFNITCVNFFQIPDPTNPDHPNTTLFIVASTGDGEIKMFRSGDSTSLLQIQFQNRPLSCLAMDPSHSLMYTLDETDPSLLSIANFFRGSDANKGSDALKRNIKFERNLTSVSFNFAGDTFTAVCDGNSVKSLSLKVT